MPTNELIALLAFISAMTFTPGPNTTLSTALAANHGLRHALRFVVSVPVGWALMIVGCAFGLGALIESLPVLRGAIKWLGIAYMLWLAWKLSRSGELTRARDGTLDVGFLQGVMLQFINVKAWMNALLISASWVAVATPVMPRLLIVLPVMMAYGFASNFTYALVGSALRGWLAQGRRLLWFNRILAAVLLGTALWMARL